MGLHPHIKTQSMQTALCFRLGGVLLRAAWLWAIGHSLGHKQPLFVIINGASWGRMAAVPPIPLLTWLETLIERQLRSVEGGLLCPEGEKKKSKIRSTSKVLCCLVRLQFAFLILHKHMHRGCTHTRGMRSDFHNMVHVVTLVPSVPNTYMGNMLPCVGVTGPVTLGWILCLLLPASTIPLGGVYRTEDMMLYVFNGYNACCRQTGHLCLQFNNCIPLVRPTKTCVLLVLFHNFFPKSRGIVQGVGCCSVQKFALIHGTQGTRSTCKRLMPYKLL